MKPSTDLSPEELAAKEARKAAAREQVNQSNIRAELCAVVYHGRLLGE